MILAEPAETPVTTPVDELTVAMPVASLVQTPPASPDAVSVVLAAAQTVVVPLIEPAFGAGLTDTTVALISVPQELVTV